MVTIVLFTVRDFVCTVYDAWLMICPLNTQKGLTILPVFHHYIYERDVITARKRSLRRLCFYTYLSVILFTVGEYLGRNPPGIWYIPQNRYTPGTRYIPPGPGYPSGPGTPPHLHPGPGTPPPPGPGTPPARYGQQAGGTHPTGMHSCLDYEDSRMRHGLFI